jgi:Flp pilus assembly protein TadG
MSRSTLLREQRGQTMVEFALVLPLLCMILLGIVQFGIVFNDYLSLTDGVRAGARKAVVSRQLAQPDEVAKAAVRASAVDLDSSKLKIDVKASPGWDRGADVTVTASYPYEISLLGLVVFKNGELTSSTTERLE